MRIFCPYCSSEHSVDPNQIPLVGMDFACPHCQHSFRVGADGEVEARDDFEEAPPSEPMFTAPGSSPDLLDTGLDLDAPQGAVTEEERAAAALGADEPFPPLQSRSFPEEDEATEVVPNTSDYVAGDAHEPAPFVQPTAAPDQLLETEDEELTPGEGGSYHRTSRNLTQPADVVWKEGEGPAPGGGGFTGATWPPAGESPLTEEPQPAPTGGASPDDSVVFADDELGMAETVFGSPTPPPAQPPTAPPTSPLHDDVYGGGGPEPPPKPEPGPAAGAELDAPFELEDLGAPAPPEAPVQGDAPPSAPQDDWSFPDLDFDADPFGSPPIDPVPPPAPVDAQPEEPMGDMPPVPPEEDVFDLGMLDEVVPDPVPEPTSTPTEKPATEAVGQDRDGSGLFDLDYEIGESQPPQPTAEPLEAMDSMGATTPPDLPPEEFVSEPAAAQDLPTSGAEEMDFSALLREEVGEDDYLQETERLAPGEVEGGGTREDFGDELGLDELPEDDEGDIYDTETALDLHDQRMAPPSPAVGLGDSEFAPASVPRPSERRGARPRRGGRGLRVALLAVLLIVVAGLLGGQFPEVGYFGINLIYPPAPKTTRTAVAPPPKPVKVDEEALKSDTIADYIKQIDDLEKRLKTDPKAPGAKQALADLLQRFGSRFPKEFGHNKRYQRRLDELSEELRMADEGTFAARKALMSGDPSAARKALDMHVAKQAGGADVQLLYGQIEMRDGHYNKAIAHLDEALAAKPDSVEARYLLGDCYRRLDKLPEAREAFEAVLKKSPKHDSARIGLAEIQLAMGEGAKALELAQGILSDAVDRKLTEQTFVAHSLLARINAQLGNTDAELRHLEEAASIKPLDETILLALARYLSNREQFEAAKEKLESCWGKGCQSAQYFRELAAIYLELAELDRAIECIDVGLGKHENDLTLLRLRGRARMRRGDMVAAKEAYERVVELAPQEAEAYLELATLLLKTDRQDEALVLLQKGIDKVTAPASLLERLSDVYTRMGEHTKARQTLADLVEQDPMNFEARLKLAERLKSIGLVNEALPHYEFLYRNDQLQRGVRLSYADALREARKYDEAERELQQLVQHDPSDLRARVLLGAVLVEVDRHDEAETYLRDAAEKDPLDSMAQYYLGRLALTRDKQKDALQFFGKAMAGKEPLPEYRYQFGQTLLRIGGRKNLQEAVGAFSGIITRYEDGKVTGGVFERMCDVYLARGNARMGLLRFDKALEDFEKAMDIDPLRADAVTAVASGLVKKRRYKEAERYLMLVIEENPHYAGAHYQLGLLYGRRGEKQKARKHFHAAIAEDELAFPLAYRHLGFLYREKRMDREARRYFMKYLALAGDDAKDAEDIKRMLGME